MTAPDEADAGLTLVELIVSVVIAGIILSLIATIFVTTLQANAATRDRDLASGRAQAISTSLTTSVRNADAVTVQTLAGGGTVVRARVATGASGWECRAWAVADLETTDAAGRRTGADGRFELRAHTSAPLSGTATAPAPTTAWGTLTEHVEKTKNDNGTGTGKPFFAIDGTRVTWNLVVSVGEQPQLNAQSLTAVAGSAVARARETKETARCW